MNIKISVASLLFLCHAANATEWSVFGARARGMGGAAVAQTNGPIGSYWNPASLALEGSASGVEIPVGAHLTVDGNVLKGANDLNELSSDCPNGPKCTQANIDAALTSLNEPGNGVRADVAGGVEIKIKKLAVFVNNFIYVGAMPRVDTVNTTPANLAAGTNTSKLVVRGLSVLEIGVGYALGVPFIPGLTAGAGLKGLIGRAGYTDFQIFHDDAGGSKSLNKFLDNSKKSFQPGLDLGLLWDLGKLGLPLRPKAGITARNINNPRFDQPEQAKLAGQRDHFSLHGNSRVGLSISPFNFWHIAADADLTRNLTVIDGQASQVVAVGTEVNIVNRPSFNLPLRFGISNNVAQKGSKTALSAGLGLNILHFHLDLAGYMTPASQSIQTQGESRKVPTSAGAAVEIALLF